MASRVSATVVSCPNLPLNRRPATDADLPFLLELRQESMGPHLAAAGLHGSTEDFMARVRHRFDRAEILELEGRPIGLLKLVREPGHWEVLQLQISSAARGQGIGRRLMESVLADAAIAGARVTLSVLKPNPARRLYERLGFVVVGEDEHEFFMSKA